MTSTPALAAKPPPNRSTSRSRRGHNPASGCGGWIASNCCGGSTEISRSSCSRQAAFPRRCATVRLATLRIRSSAPRFERCSNAVKMSRLERENRHLWAQVRERLRHRFLRGREQGEPRAGRLCKNAVRRAGRASSFRARAEPVGNSWLARLGRVNFVVKRPSEDLGTP